MGLKKRVDTVIETIKSFAAPPVFEISPLINVISTINAQPPRPPLTPLFLKCVELTLLEMEIHPPDKSEFVDGPGPDFTISEAYADAYFLTLQPGFEDILWATIQQENGIKPPANVIADMAFYYINWHQCLLEKEPEWLQSLNIDQK